ncbi:MAG TPA: TIGR04219 family outer membrane beta-barrel protein, partial [Agitococcus sp.]|nr:TIGR04219 family outer membrane beta-barrel protein [Agitococcus sp.]
TVSIKETIPMAYVSAQAKLPLTGLSVKADVAGVSYNGSSLSDVQAEIMYNFVDNLAVDIGIKAGYRQITATLEDIEDTDADIEFKGPYLGLEMHF